MKKIILVVSAVLLSTGAFAQERGFEWGIKAGLNLANVTKVDDAKFKPAFAAGVFGEYVINDYFGVQAELLYAMEGYKLKEGGIDLTDKRDYIQLPIFAKFYILKGLSIDVGPRFGYALSGKFDGTVAEGVDKQYYDKDGFKKFDVSAVLGASYKFQFGLDVFARYNLGFTKVFDKSDVKNGAVLFGVGFRF